VSRSRYWVRPVLGGEELEPSEQIDVSNPLGEPYIAISLQGDYTFQKVGIADLDGDGLYDFVIKQPDVNIDPFSPNWRPSEGTYKIEAYLGDGTFLWRNDLGWSIEQGMWYSPYVGYDLDGELIADEGAFDAGLNPRAVYWGADLQRELLVGGRIYDYETGHIHLEGVNGRLGRRAGGLAGRDHRLGRGRASHLHDHDPGSGPPRLPDAGSDLQARRGPSRHGLRPTAHDELLPRSSIRLES